MPAVTLTVTAKDEAGQPLTGATVKCREINGTGTLTGTTDIVTGILEDSITVSRDYPTVVLVTVSKAGSYRAGVLVEIRSTAASAYLVLRTNRG